MFAPIRRGSLLLAAAGLAAAVAVAAPAPSGGGEKTAVVKDRAGFIPRMKFEPLPGKAVGVTVSDVQAMTWQEGRGGPADAIAFSRDGNSYRWTYVPADGKGTIQGLRMKAGEKGDELQVYPNLNMANPQSLKQFDVTAPYALVEVEVNAGLGAPADQGFVATKMKRLDDTREYPLSVPRVVADLRKRYQAHLKAEDRNIEAALAKEQKASLKDRKLTGPREKSELFYVTWMDDSQRLVVRFRTRVTDGAYQYAEGPVRGRPVPLPLPPGRGPKGKGFAFPPAPPRMPRVRFGTSITAELGMAYEVNKDGKVVRTLRLPLATSHQEIPPPPAFRVPPPTAPKLPPL